MVLVRDPDQARVDDVRAQLRLRQDLVRERPPTDQVPGDGDQASSQEQTSELAQEPTERSVLLESVQPGYPQDHSADDDEHEGQHHSGPGDDLALHSSDVRRHARMLGADRAGPGSNRPVHRDPSHNRAPTATGTDACCGDASSGPTQLVPRRGNPLQDSLQVHDLPVMAWQDRFEDGRAHGVSARAPSKGNSGQLHHAGCADALPLRPDQTKVSSRWRRIGHCVRRRRKCDATSGRMMARSLAAVPGRSSIRCRSGRHGVRW